MIRRIRYIRATLRVEGLAGRHRIIYAGKGNINANTLYN